MVGDKENIRLCLGRKPNNPLKIVVIQIKNY